MPFKFSKRSLRHLEEVVEPLRAVAVLALKTSNVDFGVTDGLRTEEEQRELLAAGASKTLKSRHLTGHAIDVAAYIGPRLKWEPQTLYDEIANAFGAAARELETPIRWGGAWNCGDIGAANRPARELRYLYRKQQTDRGRAIFNDSVHFEIPAERN